MTQSTQTKPYDDGTGIAVGEVLEVYYEWNTWEHPQYGESRHIGERYTVVIKGAPIAASWWYPRNYPEYIHPKLKEYKQYDYEEEKSI